MKVKIFKGSSGNPGNLEIEINNWLTAHPGDIIISLTQTEVTINQSSQLIVTILYR